MSARGFGRARAGRRAFCGLVVAGVWSLGVCVGGAGATVTHVLDGAATTALLAGVPEGCGSERPEPPCISGAFGNVESLVVTGGRVWVSDRPDGVHGRIDEFEAVSPWGFVGPQMDEEAGVTGIGARGSRFAVGGAGGEKQVYALARREGHEVIAVYGAATGKLLGSWAGGRTVNKSFTESAGKTVAVLRGVAVAPSGEVYVATGAGSTPSYHVVDVFSSESTVVGEEPKVVATLEGTCANAGTACAGEAIPFVEPEGVAVSPANGDVYVSDASGAGAHPVLDVFRPGVLNEYVFVGQITGPPAGSLREVAGVAGDSGVGAGEGEVYVADTSPGSEPGGLVYQFDETGGFLGRLTGPSSSSVFDVLAGVGVDAGSHDVFVAEDDLEAPGGPTSRIDVFGPDVVLPDVETDPAVVSVDNEGHLSATLKGTVNSNETEVTTCVFVWGLTSQFGRSVPCEEEPGNGGTAAPVQATIGTGLEPDTTYMFRLQAGNTNGLNTGEEHQNQSFHTPGPGIHSVSSSDVAATSATLESQVDPNKAASTAFFQYTTAESSIGCGFGSEACSVAPISGSDVLGEGSVDVGVSEHILGLTPGMAYHYRLVVTSKLLVKGTPTAVTFFSADQTLETSVASSPESGLLDGRQWELVSPPNKHGAVIYKPGISGISEAAEGGDLVSYPFTNTTEAEAAGLGESAQVLSTRGPGGGWISRDVALPHSGAIGKGAGGGLEYKAVSSDGCAAIAEPNGPFTSLTPEVFPVDTERTPYVRENCTCPSEPTTCYAPIATGAPEGGDVPPGTKFGDEEGIRIPQTGSVKFVGGSADLRHVMVASIVQLTSLTTPAGVRELYEWSAEKPPAERLQLVSRDEGSHASPVAAGLGFEPPGSELDGRGAVSSDGSRVFWAEEHGGLLVRDMGKPSSVRLDVPVQGAGGGGPASPVYEGASADGSRVFFEDEERLTSNSGAVSGKPDLYVCDLVEEVGALKCHLTDLTPANGGVSANVQGSVSGFGRDGASVYFVANGVLAGTDGEGAKPGSCFRSQSTAGATCNLYVAHNDGSGWGAAKLVTVLSGDDYPDWAGSGQNFAELTAGVSDNGQWLLFLSDRSLTGYDNHDAVSEMPDEEVFEYDASSRRVVCVSCSRSGARPEGVEYGQVKEGLVGGNGNIWPTDQWLAGVVPGLEQYESSRGLYQPRFVSESGRVFFDAFGGLVSGDVNGVVDVYEREPAGVGDCSAGSAGFGAGGGCLGLVSSGRGAGESVFVDASASGGDVFFLSGERLVHSDLDTAVDLYDAHECTGVSPCPGELESPPGCVTADSCRAGVSPAPSIFGAPASSTFSGEGNTKPAPAAPVKKPKTAAEIKAEKLTRALKTCKRDRKKGKRHACEVAARKKYGKKVVKKKKKVSRSSVVRSQVGGVR
jgi:hypothetical protein